jgi:hypothetical protein
MIYLDRLSSSARISRVLDQVMTTVVNATNIGGHSVRTGMATQAASNGSSERDSCVLTRNCRQWHPSIAGHGATNSFTLQISMVFELTKASGFAVALITRLYSSPEI